MDMLWIAINHYFLLYCRCQGSNRHAISCLPIKNVQYSNKRKPKFWVKSPSRRWLKVTRSTTVVCVNLTLLQIHLCIFQVLKHKIPQRHCCFFFKSHFRMYFFSCLCLLSEFTDQIKAIGFPQTLCHQYFTGQMQSIADLLHRLKV